MRDMFVFSDGGLGNRLNSLVGGLVIADELNCNPKICWPLNNWCWANFNDLFDTNFTVLNQSINELFVDENLIYLIHENQIGKTFKKTFDHSLTSLKKIKETNENIIYFHNKLPSFVDSNLILTKLKKLQIKKDIINHVEKFCIENNINKNTKGVHLRKTDHGRQLDSNIIFDEIQKNQNQSYFVCSDDSKTEQEFSQLKNVKIFSKTSYVEKLIDGSWTSKIKDTDGRIFPYNVNRPSQSVIEGFIDLLILSRTNIIIKNKSSFLGWAKIYSMIDNLQKVSL